MLQAPMFMKVDGGKLNGQITVKALLQWCREILFQLSVSSSVSSIVLDLWLSIAIFECRSVGVFKLHFFSNETNCDWIGQLCSYQEMAETARPARSNHARLYVRQVDVGKMMVIVWLLLWTATISIIFLCSHIFCSYSWE